jgi:hypothetical protein
MFEKPTYSSMVYALEHWTRQILLMDDEALELLDGKLRIARERIAAELKRRKESEPHNE